jgi:predicted nucleic acid-binding protein
VIAVDTNVLLYAVDSASGPKAAMARAAVARWLRRGDAMIPLQVIGEFLSVASRRPNVSADDAFALTEAWTSAAAIEPYATPDMGTAWEAHRAHGLSFWDALIWSVCERAGCEILATEDLQDGRRLGRVTFLSPFEQANASRLGLA